MPLVFASELHIRLCSANRRTRHLCGKGKLTWCGILEWLLLFERDAFLSLPFIRYHAVLCMYNAFVGRNVPPQWRSFTLVLRRPAIVVIVTNVLFRAHMTVF